MPKGAKPSRLSRHRQSKPSARKGKAKNQTSALAPTSEQGHSSSSSSTRISKAQSSHKRSSATKQGASSQAPSPVSCEQQRPVRLPDQPSDENRSKSSTEQIKTPGDKPKEDLAATPWDPFEFHVFKKGEKEFGQYYARLSFDCEPCPENSRFTDDRLDTAAWEKTKVGQRRIQINQQESRKKHKHSGQHLVQGNSQRMCAAEKYLLWRTKTLRKIAKTEAKRPCLVNLIELDPCGHQSEAAFWAQKIKALKQIFRSLAPGTRIKIWVMCAINPSLLKGFYTEWYQAILDLKKDWPNQVFVEILNDSVMDTDVASHYPAQPDYSQVAYERLNMELMRYRCLLDVAPTDELKAKIAPPPPHEFLLNVERKTYQARCDNIRHNIEFCRDFVRAVRPPQEVQVQSTWSERTTQDTSGPKKETGMRNHAEPSHPIGQPPSTKRIGNEDGEADTEVQPKRNRTEAPMRSQEHGTDLAKVQKTESPKPDGVSPAQVQPQSAKRKRDADEEDAVVYVCTKRRTMA